ncbi:ribonuclease III [Horticoccus luteus]|uniref:Ribonuclease 3 n=1 Tax=Horticoccus luteus TaxID=2862869 RepID=A0A8F9XHL6_9BACT|nr:ribonuclease III [Horticoccus luteus]QYM80377.1 ribonuclease III [Horticoccus luteus]
MSTALSFQRRIGYTFRNVDLLERALTHPSWLQDHPEAADSNQRLEFLGDAVLDLIIAEAIFHADTTAREGDLTQRRKRLIEGRFLSQLALEIGLDAALHLSASEESTGGRHKSAALEDAFEALVAAIFLDAGLEETRRVVLGLYGPLERRLASTMTVDNPKGRLQERVQPEHGNNALHYEVVRTEGADHARAFEVTVSLHGQELGTGRGSSKKAAEAAAAAAALLTLDRLP